MAFLLSEDQQILERTVREFARKHMPVSRLRALRDGRDPVGFSREAWTEMAALGLAGILCPESYGGSGLGYTELGLVLEACGRNLSATPLVATVLCGGNAVLLAGSDAQRREILPGVCRGEHLLALAHEEGTHHAPYRVATRAEPVGSGYRLFGTKTFVLDGHVADTLVVAARTGGREDEHDGITLLLVPAASAGVDVTRTFLVDSRNAATVRFEGVEVPAANVLGTPGEGADLLDAVLDRATIGLCAEMLGGIEEAFDKTISYLKERRQFGVPIGSFQALKHRAARMFCEVELTRSVVLDALRAVDEGRQEVPMLASAAKARATDTFLLVANEAIQMHGGIGVTDELDIGFYLKRARVAEMTFGDAAYHRDRFGRVQGF